MNLVAPLSNYLGLLSNGGKPSTVATKEPGAAA